MEGSDDEFSDLGEVEEDEQDDTFCLHPRSSSPGSSGAYTSPTSRSVTTHQNAHTPTNTDNCTSWSSSLNPVTIKAFTSPVSPTVPISASPVDVFQLFFSGKYSGRVIGMPTR